MQFASVAVFSKTDLPTAIVNLPNRIRLQDDKLYNIFITGAGLFSDDTNAGLASRNSRILIDVKPAFDDNNCLGIFVFQKITAFTIVTGQRRGRSYIAKSRGIVVYGHELTHRNNISIRIVEDAGTPPPDPEEFYVTLGICEKMYSDDFYLINNRCHQSLTVLYSNTENVRIVDNQGKRLKFEPNCKYRVAVDSLCVRGSLLPSVDYRDYPQGIVVCMDSPTDSYNNLLIEEEAGRENLTNNVIGSVHQFQDQFISTAWYPSWTTTNPCVGIVVDGAILNSANQFVFSLRDENHVNINVNGSDGACLTVGFYKL